jgi:DMSO/TMAO reductase YedYZ molybdopterin-dependent catalytic subunit
MSGAETMGERENGNEEKAPASPATSQDETAAAPLPAIPIDEAVSAPAAAAVDGETTPEPLPAARTDEPAPAPTVVTHDAGVVSALSAAAPGSEAITTPPTVAQVSESPAAPHVVTAPDPDAAVERTIRRMSRRALIGGALAVGAGWAGLRWLDTRPAEDELIWPLRRVLQLNARLFHGTFRRTALAPEFPLSAAREPINNYHDETPEVEPSEWSLELKGARGGEQELDLEEIKRLPRVTQVTELKCIEGWSTVVAWAGVRFADFAARYPPMPGARYVRMDAENDDYYVGLDLESCLHPQTLLAYEMNGRPLTSAHGAPLRLVIPVKYGIKNIKLITRITYTAHRPEDYWAQQGYDWYAGL